MRNLSEVSYEGQKQFNGLPAFLTMFAPVFAPKEESSRKADLQELVSLIKEHNTWIKEKLLDCGALGFRGWAVKDAKDFAAIVEAFGYKDMPYNQGEAKRDHIYGPVFTANASSVELDVAFHNEMAYLDPNHPDVIIFFCETPSTQGGGTAFVRGDIAYQKLLKEMPEYVNKLEEKGVIYSYVPQRGWESTFLTTDLMIARARAQEVNASLEWDSEVQQYMIIRGPLPASKAYLGRSTWFNSLCLEFKKKHVMKYGDGSPIAKEDIQKSLSFLKEEQSLVQWEAGDVVIANNHSVLHARVAGKPPRNILVALGKNGK